jgi:6-pyruvoyltetrahydropterin/6-carboxytetrahydropterin synthase
MWHQWIDDAVDHSFQLSERDPLVEYFLDQEPAGIPRLLITPGDPTTECLAACFFEKLTAFLREQSSLLEVASIKISETPTNAVTLDAISVSLLPAMSYVPWWQRADMTINDLRPRVASFREETTEVERAIQG